MSLNVSVKLLEINAVIPENLKYDSHFIKSVLIIKRGRRHILEVYHPYGLQELSYASLVLQFHI